MKRGCLLLDWGDTLMRVFPEYSGPMVTWPRVEAVDGAAETLERLRPDWIVALATNAAESGEAEIWAALERGGLKDRVDRVYCYRGIGLRKPSPEYFAYILADLGLEARQVVMVGDDSEGDVLGANRSGLRAVWLNARTAEARDGLLLRTIHRLSELPAALRSFSAEVGGEDEGGLDVMRARRDTPGCERVRHFNNAGASLMPYPVLDAVTGHLRLEAEIGGYEAADLKREAVEQTYDALAALIGSERDEIAVVENATRAWDMAFYSFRFGPGDRILTSMAEYASNYIAFLQVAQRTGATVEAIPNDEHGQVSVRALETMLDGNVRLIAVTHVPTNGGLVNPAAEIGRVARAAHIPYLLDACQSVGQMPVSVVEIGCDLLSATGRKYLRGPRGTGFLYVRRDVLDRLDPPFLDLHAARWVARDRFEVRYDARRFENWETYYAGKIGLGVAAGYARQWGLAAIWARVRDLAAGLRAGLAALPGVRVRDLGATKCGIVSFTVDGHAPEEIVAALARERINVTASTVAATRLDMEQRGLAAVVRASPHYYNTEAEVGLLCDAVAVNVAAAGYVKRA